MEIYEAYRKLRSDLRKDVKEDYEHHRKKWLREATVKKRSLRVVEKDIRLN